MYTYHAKEQLELPRAITLARAAGSVGLAELLCAARDGEIGLLTLLPGTSHGMFKTWSRATAKSPAIVLIGDDDYQDHGPARWQVAERAIRWARSILLHATAADLSHYQAVILAVQAMKRAVVIECSAATLIAWKEIVVNAPHRPAILVLEPIDGVHPVLPAAGQLH